MSRMARDTKFGYGFLLVGGGMPYLVDKWFGVLPAMIIAAMLVLLGVIFLVAGHVHEKASPKQWRIAIAAIVVFSAATLAWPIIEYAKPSFAMVRPVTWTLPSARSTEIFITDEVGHESLDDVEILFQDDDRVAEMKRDVSKTPDLMPQALQRFNYPEMDPGPQIWAKWMFIDPLIPGHQHYTVYASSRGTPRPRFQEDIASPKSSGIFRRSR